MAKTHMFIFLEAVENDVDEIKKTAVEVGTSYCTSDHVSSLCLTGFV